jgi:FtsH-binding integral membrane protein
MAAESRGGVDLEANVPVAQAVPVQSSQVQDVQYAQQVQAELTALDKMERSIRHAFARKVFALLTLQLSVMMGVICIFLYVPEVRDYCRTPGSTWLTIVAGFLLLLSTVCLSCIPELNKRYPLNIVGLFVIGVLAGIFIGKLTAHISPEYVWIAFASSLGLMLSLGLFASQTKFDFTGIGPYLTAGIMVIFIFSMFGGFAPLFTSDWQNGGRGIVWLALVLILVSMYIVYDVQLVLGGKHRLRFSVDDYIVATISLFSDFLLVFGAILGAMGQQ